MKRRYFMMCSLLSLSAVTKVQAMTLSESINKTARCRMLTQRAVKAYALVALKAGGDQARAVLTKSSKELSEALSALNFVNRGRKFATSKDNFARLVLPFISDLNTEPSLGKLANLAQASDQVLAGANEMVELLEASTNVSTAKLVNLAGRQRMLTQRMARHYLLAHAKLDGGTGKTAIDSDKALFLSSHKELSAAPITSPAIKGSLEKSQTQFAVYLAALDQASNLESLARQSESLLAELDTQTQLFEVAIGGLIGA